MTLYGAPFADPLRPWETDVDVLPYRSPAPDGLESASCLAAWWVYLTAAIATALVAVLVVIGIRRFA